MKTTYDYAIQCFDYLVNHFPHINFEYAAGDSVHIININCNDNPQQSVTVNLDGIHPEYFYQSKAYSTPAMLALAIAKNTGQSIRFGESVVDTVNALVPPFAGHPFTLRIYRGRVLQIFLLFNTDAQLRQIPYFTSQELSQAFKYHETNPLHPQVLAALQNRSRQLRANAKPTSCYNLHPGRQQQLQEFNS